MPAIFETSVFNQPDYFTELELNKLKEKGEIDHLLSDNKV